MIHANSLTKYYGERTALDGVSFEIQEGECVGFLGRNGAGKSTLLRILATALLPSAGTVRVAGIDLVDDPHEARKRIGYLPEEPPLYGEMTVRGYLSFLAQLRGVAKADTAARVEEAAAKTNLAAVLDDPIRTLSLGYRKRVGIAQAIVHRPPVVIVDEPISGLDPAQIADMRELLKSLRGKHTVLLSSHILSEVSQTCDRVFVIDRGRILAQGKESELRGSLTSARRVRLEVRGSREALQAALSKVAEVASHRILLEEGGVLSAEVEMSSDATEAIAAKVVGDGLGLRSMRRADDDLENVFLELTQLKGAA